MGIERPVPNQCKALSGAGVSPELNWGPCFKLRKPCLLTYGDGEEAKLPIAAWRVFASFPSEKAFQGRDSFPSKRKISRKKKGGRRILSDLP